MNQCPNCGEAISEGALFCMKCGHSIPKAAPETQPSTAASSAVVCPGCGAALTPGALFCMNCGRQTQQSGAAASVAEPSTPLPAQAIQQSGYQTVNQADQTGVQQPVIHQTAAYQANQSAIQQNIVQPGVQPSPQPGPQPGAAPVATVYNQAPAAPQTPAAASVSAPAVETEAKKTPFYKKRIVIIAAAVLLVVIAAVGYVFGAGVINIGGGADISGRFIPSAEYAAYIKDGELNIANIKSLDSFEATSDLFSGMSNRNILSSRLNYSELVQMTKNGSKLFYPDRFIEDGSYNLFMRAVSGGGNSPGEPARVDTDIRGGYRVNENGSKVFYIKGEAKTLYSNNLKDKEKISSNVEEFIVDKSGNRLYYIDSDAGLYYKNRNNAPEKVDSEVRLIGASPDLASVYYIKDGTLYRKKQNENKEKLAAGVSEVVNLYDSGELYYIREADSDGKAIDILCYHDGATETKLGAGQAFEDYLALSRVRPVLAYTVNPSDDKFSEYRIAVKGADAEINISKTFRSPRFNANGTRIYYIDDFNETRQTGDLWFAEVAEDGLKQAAHIYEDVYSYNISSKGAVRYYSELNKARTTAEFYIDGKLVDTDVLTYSDSEIAESGNILYYTDYNTSRERGTLKISEKGKPQLVADDVYAFAPFNSKTVAYLVVEGSSSSGDLLRYDGSKDRKRIDSDVTMALPVYLTGSGGRIRLVSDIY